MDICTLLFNEKVAFPNLQTLHIFRIPVEKIWHNLPPKISSCVQSLTEVTVFGCGNLKELFSSSTVITEESRAEETRDKIVFPKLNSLRIQNLEKLITLWSGYYIEFPTLEEFRIKSCPQLDAFIFDDKVAFPNLQSLHISRIPVEKIWHNLPPKISSCVQNLTELSVFGCGNLKELFSSSTVVMEQSREEEMRDTIWFPILNCLSIQKLEKLTTLWSGYHIEFPTLKEFIIDRCPQLDAFIFDDKVRVPSLQKMKIRYMDNLKMIWHNNQLDGDSFSKLKSLHVCNCQKLLTLFPSNICGRNSRVPLKNLKNVQSSNKDCEGSSSRHLERGDPV
ncbi:hypothetical protein Q3G72_003741 [Acer saccharum]|nr:hypothetical protein Q3G72_003741 [Acer saccharum]